MRRKIFPILFVAIVCLLSIISIAKYIPQSLPNLLSLNSSRILWVDFRYQNGSQNYLEINDQDTLKEFSDIICNTKLIFVEENSIIPVRKLYSIHVGDTSENLYSFMSSDRYVYINNRCYRVMGYNQLYEFLDALWNRDGLAVE